MLRLELQPGIGSLIRLGPVGARILLAPVARRPDRRRRPVSKFWIGRVCAGWTWLLRCLTVSKDFATMMIQRRDVSRGGEVGVWTQDDYVSGERYVPSHVTRPPPPPISNASNR